MPIRKAQTKQISIQKAFKRAKILQPDDTDDLLEEIKQLEQQLKEKHKMCFELQTEKFRRVIPITNKNTSEILLSAAQTEVIIAKNEVEKLKDAIYQISLLTGMEVQSIKMNDHCSVVFHMQHHSDTVVKHGLKIDMRNGRQHITEYALPLGFNLSAVLEGFDSVATPKCLSAIRNALITYYDRLNQFEQLKKSALMVAQFFKTLDTSHVEISTTLHNVRNPDEDPIDFIFIMKYRTHDIRPKQIYVKNNDDLENVLETILQQCTVFKKKPLAKAFKEAFVTGVGPYKLLAEAMMDDLPRETRRRPKRHRAANGNNDDTFRPEECSDSGHDEE